MPIVIDFDLNKNAVCQKLHSQFVYNAELFC